MTSGRVVGLQARIDIVLRPPNGRRQSIEFVVDTGFLGALTLPASAVLGLGLPHVGRLDAYLADGSSTSVPVHETIIVWDGADVPVAVLAMGDRPLLGTALLDGFNLDADFEDNGSVVIQHL